MKRITRCPSCATVYQLTELHLHAAKGWLRCGACGHVFDSTGLVLDWSPASAGAHVSAEIPESHASESPPQSVSEALPLADLVPDPADRISLDHLLTKEDRSLPATIRPAQAELVAFEDALSSFKAEPLNSDALPSSPKVSKVLPFKAWLAPYGVLILALLLVIQLAYVQRDAIVASWPDSESMIRQVCQSVGCQLSPLRDPEGMVIDSSSLVQRSEDHVLSWSVRNTSQRVLGMTALELSLMDQQGKLVLRTVLLPVQWGAPQTLSPGQSWSGSLKVLVSADLVFSDYRMLSFYP
jgi:predicted Zn finger-like uncharacterized protein